MWARTPRTRTARAPASRCGTRPCARPGGPHAPQATVLHDGTVVAVALGTDTRYGYRLAADGRLGQVWTAPAGAGTGPRHLVQAPTGRCYVADELGSTVSVYVPGPD